MVKKKRSVVKNKKADNRNIKNKRAAEMTIGTIIIIILALVVLVVLIYGFSSGWGSLWDKLTGYGGGQVNVQTVVDGCKIACSTTGAYSYCTKINTVIFDKNSSNPNRKRDMTCRQLESEGVGLSCDVVDCSGMAGADKCKNYDGITVSANSNECNGANKVEVDLYDLSSKSQTCCITKKTCQEWGGSLEDSTTGNCPIRSDGRVNIPQDNTIKMLSVSTDQKICCIPRK